MAFFTTPRRIERHPGARAPLPVNPGARLADPRNAAHSIGEAPPVQPGARSQGVGAGAGNHDPNAGMGVIVILAFGFVSCLLFPPLGAVYFVVFVVGGIWWLVDLARVPRARRRGYADTWAWLVDTYGEPDLVPPVERERLLRSAGVQDTPEAQRAHLAAYTAATEGPRGDGRPADEWEPGPRTVNLDNWKFDID